MIIQTARLILRKWREEDLQAFAEMNADPIVREFFPSTLNKDESDQLALNIIKDINEQGWGFWALSTKDSDDFIGFIGLSKPTFQAHFTPTVEIGWRLAHHFWGKGYGTEGALAVLKYAFETLHLPEVTSFTAVQNVRSQKIMKKIGLHHDPVDNFDHPLLADGHWLKRHVLYRLTKEEWNKSQP
jgi:3-dehydroquinate dehydratase/shikimate dehydrogenase